MKQIANGLKAQENFLNRKPAAKFVVRDMRLRFNQLTTATNTNYPTDKPQFNGKDIVAASHCTYNGKIYSVYTYSNFVYFRAITSGQTPSQWNTWTTLPSSTTSLGTRPGIYADSDGIYVVTIEGSYLRRYVSTDGGSTWTGFSMAIPSSPYSIPYAVACTGRIDGFVCSVDATSAANKLYVWRFDYSQNQFSVWPNTIFSTSISQTSCTHFGAAQLDADTYVVVYEESELGLAMACRYQDGMWSAPRALVPMDMLSNGSSFRAYGVTAIQGVLWVPGKMVRPSTVTATDTTYDIQFDAMVRSDDGEHWTFDRNCFICAPETRGQILLPGDGYVYYPGMISIYCAPATYLIDPAGDPAGMKYTFSSLGDNITQGEIDIPAADGSASQLSIGIPSTVASTLIKGGAQIWAYLGYDASGYIQPTWPTPSAAWKWNDGKMWPTAGDPAAYQLIDVFDIDQVNTDDADGSHAISLVARSSSGKALSLPLAQDYQYQPQIKWTWDMSQLDKITRLNGTMNIMSSAMLQAITASQVDNMSLSYIGFTGIGYTPWQAFGGLTLPDFGTGAYGDITAGNKRGAYYPLAQYGPDCEVAYATDRSNIYGTYSIYARVSNPTLSTFSGYKLTVTTATGSWQLYSVVNGTATAIGAAFTQTVAAGFTVGLRCIGNSIEAWFKPYGGSWAMVGYRLDSTITAAGFSAFDLLTTVTNQLPGVIAFSAQTVTASGHILMFQDYVNPTMGWWTGPEGISTGIKWPVEQIQLRFDNSATGKSAGLLLNGLDNNNYWYARMTSSSIDLVEVANSTITVVSTISFAPSANTWYWLKATYRGGRFQVWTRTNGSADWAMQIDYTHALPRLPVFGNTEGYVGIRGDMTADSISFRNAFAWDEHVDTTIDWLLQDVATIAGILQAERDYVVPPSPVASEWWSTAQIDHFELYAKLPGEMNDAGASDTSSYISFRSSNNTWATANGYAIGIKRTNSGTMWTIAFIKRTGSAYNSATDDLERIVIPNMRIGNNYIDMRLVVVNNWITVYLNGYPVASFNDTSITRSGYIGFYKSFGSAALANVFVPELCQWRDAMISDMGGTPLSAIQQIIEGRFIKLHGTENGMRYGKFSTPDDAGTLSTAIFQDQAGPLDSSRISLIRVAGMEVVETIDPNVARDYGLIFGMTDNPAGNIAADMRNSGTRYLTISQQQADQRNLIAAPMLELQPEDKVTLTYTKQDGRSVNQAFLVNSLGYSIGPAQMMMKLSMRKYNG